VAGNGNTEGGDNRFYNNMFVGRADAAGAATRDPKTLVIKGFGLWVYDTAKYPLQTGGNVYFHGARPYTNETDALVLSGIDPKIQVVEETDGVHIRMTLPDSVRRAAAKRVTTALLGKAKVAGLAYENADGSPVVIDYDYFGKKRAAASPSPGPFEDLGSGDLQLKVW
jgi:hypothetical protein